MNSLRWLLLAGMALHKAVWMILARNGQASSQPSEAPAAGHRPVDPFKRAVKLAKVGFLVFLAFQTLFLRLWPISDRPGKLRQAGVAIYLIGLLTALAGRLELGRNWANIEDSRVLGEQQVVATGIYRLIRHPIYVGDALLLIGLQLALNSWLVIAMLAPVVVFVRQALAEEATLSASLPGYDDYSRQSWRFIPFLI